MLTKVHLVKAMVFPVVMYGCESWTVKKAEHWKIDVFELWCWRRLLRVPWTARTSSQSILKEISPGCSLEGLMLKLKLQYFGHLMRRVDSLEKTLILGGIVGRRRREMTEDEMAGWHHWLWAWVWINSGSCWWTGRPRELRFMGSQRVRHDWTTELNWIFHCVYVPQLPYPFICQWTPRLLPCLAFVNSAVMNSGIHVSFSIPQGICLEWDCWVIWWFYS